MRLEPRGVAFARLQRVQRREHRRVRVVRQPAARAELPPRRERVPAARALDRVHVGPSATRTGRRATSGNARGLVGLRHAVDVVLALERAALLRRRVHQLVGEPLAIVFSRRLRRELTSQRIASVRGGAADLDGHLIGGAADAARTNLEVRRHRLDRDLELLERVLAGLLADDGERVVDDLLGVDFLRRASPC